MSAVQNNLIEMLPAPEQARLLAACVPIELTLGEVLQEAGEDTHHVYFPVDGFISMLTQVDDCAALEVGMVGREGMVGAHLALGVGVSPLQAMVQGSGTSLRMEVVPFQREMARSPAMRRQLDRYLYVLMAQMASGAGCLRFHHIGQRLARWLLMSQDRAHQARFHVTHEFLATMLGVRRVGVTLAAGELQRAGLITYQRGELTVLDRSGLEQTACSCYARDRQVYAGHIHEPGN